MKAASNEDFIVTGQHEPALFTLKLYRGEGMALLAMNWKAGRPSKDFVGFAIEYMEPGGDRFYPLKNRLSFPDAHPSANKLSTKLSPIQSFRWVHFPRNAQLKGSFTYKVTPVFMNAQDELSYGEPQQADIVLYQETYPKLLNIAFTRGFVSSQAFVDNYASAGPISELLPPKAEEGLGFTPTHPKTKAALEWMGFEARSVVLGLLDDAIRDANAQVRVVAYDLNEPEIVSRLEQLGPRLKVIIDDEGAHGEKTSAETAAEKRLRASAGNDQVKRQSMGKLQHNKMIVVNGPTVKGAVGGSTNFSWRGIYVQSNNAVLVQGANAIQPFLDAFEHYWANDTPAGFGKTGSAGWNKIDLDGIDINICFSPHSNKNAVLKTIAADIDQETTSSLFFSLAFLYQTPGVIQDAVMKQTNSDQIFTYGISDKKVGSKTSGIEVLTPNGNIAPVFPSELTGKVPEPFKSEPTGGGGTRMHHKFVIIDFDKPTARVYTGSYNFSVAADQSNGENLFLIKDRKIAVSYAIEALRMFDHYTFRLAQKEAKEAKKMLVLLKPPRTAGAKPWWDKFYTDPRRIRDRQLFG